MLARDSIYIYISLKQHYLAQKEEALASLDLYFGDSVGIGEHSNILNEFKEWTQKLCEADEALKF